MWSYFRVRDLVNRTASSYRRRHRKGNHRSVSARRPIGFEPLEARRCLSIPTGAHPGIEWTVYVNQLGNASVDQEIDYTGDLDTFRVFFDDSGTATFETSSNFDPEMGYWNDDVSSNRLDFDDDDGPGLNPHITASFSYWDPLALVVGEHGDNNTGDYTLLVNGPSASESTLTFSGFTATWMGNIGARYDYDFFKFIAPGTGTYTVEVDPTGSMDPEFVLFDNSGSPLLGTFTDPIDSGGGGTTESRTISLTAGATYHLRVDGYGSSTGDFEVTITSPSDMPTGAHSSIENTVYVNHLGDASVDQIINYNGDHDTFRVFYDNSGTATFETSSSLDLEMGYWNDDDSSSRRLYDDDSGPSLNPRITTPSFSSWDALAIEIVERGGNSTGAYTLLVDGPSASESTLTFSGFTTTRSGNIGNEYDYDFYKFIAPGTGSYTVEVDPTGSMDPEFILFDDSGSPLLGTFTDPIDSGGSGTTESRTISLTAGETYHLRVDGYGSSTGDFDITITSPSDMPTGAHSSIENTIYVNHLGDASVDRAIDFDGDHDTFRVFYDNSGTATFETSSSLDLEMGYWNDDASSSRLLYDDDSGPSLNPQITTPTFSSWDPLAVEIVERGGNSTGAYTLLADGPSASESTLGFSGFTATGSGTINDEFDYDFFEFIAPGTGSFTVEVASTSSLDPEFLLFDDSGSPLSGSFTSPIDSTGSGGTESRTFSLTAGETYHLRVDGDGASTGSFGVTITSPSDVPTGAHSLIEWDVYVNHLGDASVAMAINPNGDHDTFRVFYDNSGTATFETSGSLDLEMGYWNDDDSSSRLLYDDDSGPGLNPQITTPWFSARDALAVEIVERGGNNTGAYSLLVDGPSAAESTLTFSGFTATASDILDLEFDYDFFEFVAPATGTFTVEVASTSSLDPEFVLFDDSGSPLLGSFTSPIDSTGSGGTESRTISLTAGETYHLRVDGDGATVGNYSVAVSLRGILVSPTSGLRTSEAGGTDTFTVRLTSPPTAPVVIGLSSSDLSEGSVSLASLTFTVGNWSTAQTVTVTGMDDAVDDGDVAYTIVTAPASSTDPSYHGLNAPDVSVTNTDNETTGIVVQPTSGLVTTEGGGTDTFTVRLTSQPTAPVVIGLSSSDLSEGSVSLASLTFTAGNWSTAQTVTVTGMDDAIDDGDVAYTIVTAPASSADPRYNGLDASNVQVTNRDNDGAGIVVQPTSGLVTTEGGGTDTFTVRLTSQPTAPVVIGLSSSDLSEGSVSLASLTFTAGNWSTAQTVTVTGMDDAIDDGDVAYTIVTAPASSADTRYHGLDAPNVQVTNRDNEGGRIDLGLVDFLELPNLDPSAGALQYQLTTQHTGLLTLQAVPSGPATSVAIILYDASGTYLGTSHEVGGAQRIDWSVMAGETYAFDLTGTASDADLRIANLVHHHAGTVTVYGTDGEDTFEALAATSRFVINGVDYDPTATAPVTTLHFLGAGATDTAKLTGSHAADQIELFPDSAEVTAAGLRLLLNETEQIQIDGAGGNDRATLDGNGGEELLKLWPLHATWTANGSPFNHTLQNVETVDAQAYNDDDTADLFDSDTSRDFFVGKPGDSYLHGAGYSNRVRGYQDVRAYASAADGFDDEARLYDSDGNDTLHAGPTSPLGTKLSGTTLSGFNFSNSANGFRYVLGYAQKGGADAAHLYDSHGTRDYFIGKLAYSRLFGPEFFSQAVGFNQVYGHASADGFNDAAWVFDSDGDDTFHAGPASPLGTKLSGTTLGGRSYSYSLDGFRNVYAHAQNGGNDVAQLYDSEASLDYFVGTPRNSATYGPDFYCRAAGFEQVNGHGSASDGFEDRAKLYGSDGNDTFSAGPTSPEGTKLAGTTLAGISFSYTADGFDKVYAYSKNNGADTARLYDSNTTLDTFVAKPTYSVLYGPGFYNLASQFEQVTGRASADGFDDVVKFYDSDANDTLHAGPSSPAGTKMTGTMLSGQSFSNVADGFFYVYGYATAGGYDHANLYGLDARNDVFRAFLEIGHAERYDGSTFRSVVKKFEKVTTRGSNSDSDQAYLFDSPGNDHLQADATVDPSRAVLTGAGQEIELYDFYRIKATRTFGYDTKHEVPVLDYLLETVGGWIDV